MRTHEYKTPSLYAQISNHTHMENIKKFNKLFDREERL